MRDDAAIGYCQRWKRNAEVLACWKARPKIGLRLPGLPVAASADLAGFSVGSRSSRMYRRLSYGLGRLDLATWAICFSCL
jgi:hypothetical protein